MRKKICCLLLLLPLLLGSVTVASDHTTDSQAFQKKLQNFDKTLNRIQAASKQLKALFKYVRSLRLPVNVDELEKNLNLILAKEKKLRQLRNDKNYEALLNELDALREAVLMPLAKISSQAGQYWFLKNTTLLRAINQVKNQLQFGLPHRPFTMMEKEKSNFYRTEGELNVLVCMMRWNQNDPVLKAQDLAPIIEEADPYYYENSFGRVHLNFDFVGGDNLWTDTNGSRENLPQDYTDEAIAVANWCGSRSGVDLADYDRIFVYPSLTISPEAGGVALTSIRNLVTDEGEQVSAGVMLLKARDLDDDVQRNFLQGTSIHELGHFFGGSQKFRHSNFLECGDQSYSLNGCEEIEYGNIYDVMGRSSLMGHLSGWFKSIIGWIETKTVTNNRNTLYRLWPLEEKSPGMQMIRVPYKEDPVCIEYRTPHGYDDFAERAPMYLDAGSGWGLFMEGMAIPPEGCLLVTLCDFDPERANRPEVHLIDVVPNSHTNDYWDRTDACLRAGEVFSNQELGLTVSFTAATYSSTGQPYAKVEIAVDENRAFAQ
ncbi:MAG: hypothetical protein Q7S68_04400 [Deltaproteobacteria bacterium]|nr:hypothetical protein [Deltaproteobacteria bacterium]